LTEHSRPPWECGPTQTRSAKINSVPRLGNHKNLPATEDDTRYDLLVDLFSFLPQYWHTLWDEAAGGNRLLAMLSFGALLIQTGVGVWVWKYTRETRRLREQGDVQVKNTSDQLRIARDALAAQSTSTTEQIRLGQAALAAQLSSSAEQISLIRRQLRLSLIPYIELRIVNIVENAASTKIEYSATNHTERIAHHLMTMIRYRGEWYWDSLEVLRRLEAAETHAASPLEHDQLFQAAKEQYGHRIEQLLPLLTNDSTSFIALFFQDIDGVLHVTKRRFAPPHATFAGIPHQLSSTYSADGLESSV